MAEAVAEASRGFGRTRPNPPVGCVLVKNGREIARGYHRRAGLAHAEIEALDAAGRRARGATAYVTLEPCFHHGRTPPCADALVEAGIARVVVGARDPNPLVAGRGVRKLRRAGIRVTTGVGRESCQDLIRGFAALVISGRPYVHLKLAASLDGRIAARGGASKWISSAASRALVQRMRLRSDAILVGVGTVLADDPRLTCRLRGAPRPLRVVLDRQLRTPPGARLVSGRGSALIVTAPAASALRQRRLEAAGAEVVRIDTRGRAGWARLLAELGRRDVMEVLIEGGSAVATAAVRAGVVDALTLFTAPVFIGGDGVPVLESLGVVSPSGAPRLVDASSEVIGTDVVWHGKPQ